jgi:hypothetical protein
MNNLVIHLHILIGFKFQKQSTFLLRLVESIRFSIMNDGLQIGQILLLLKSPVPNRSLAYYYFCDKNVHDLIKKTRIHVL